MNPIAQKLKEELPDFLGRGYYFSGATRLNDDEIMEIAFHGEGPSIIIQVEDSEGTEHENHPVRTTD